MDKCIADLDGKNDMTSEDLICPCLCREDTKSYCIYICVSIQVWDFLCIINRLE